MRSQFPRLIISSVLKWGQFVPCPIVREGKRGIHAPMFTFLLGLVTALFGLIPPFGPASQFDSHRIFWLECGNTLGPPWVFKRGLRLVPMLFLHCFMLLFAVTTDVLLWVGTHLCHASVANYYSHTYAADEL